MASESNVQQIIAWFEALGKNDSPNVSKEHTSIKPKFNKRPQIVREKTSGDDFKNLIERFESGSYFQKDRIKSHEQPIVRKFSWFTTESNS